MSSEHRGARDRGPVRERANFIFPARCPIQTPDSPCKNLSLSLADPRSLFLCAHSDARDAVEECHEQGESQASASHGLVLARSEIAQFARTRKSRCRRGQCSHVGTVDRGTQRSRPAYRRAGPDLALRRASGRRRRSNIEKRCRNHLFSPRRLDEGVLYEAARAASPARSSTVLQSESQRPRPTSSTRRRVHVCRRYTSLSKSSKRFSFVYCVRT